MTVNGEWAHAKRTNVEVTRPVRVTKSLLVASVPFLPRRGSTVDLDINRRCSITNIEEQICGTEIKQQPNHCLRRRKCRDKKAEGVAEYGPIISLDESRLLGYLCERDQTDCMESNRSAFLILSWFKKFAGKNCQQGTWGRGDERGNLKPNPFKFSQQPIAQKSGPHVYRLSIRITGAQNPSTRTREFAF